MGSPKERAWFWLEKSYRERNGQWFKVRWAGSEVGWSCGQSSRGKGWKGKKAMLGWNYAFQEAVSEKGLHFALCCGQLVLAYDERCVIEPGDWSKAVHQGTVVEKWLELPLGLWQWKWQGENGDPMGMTDTWPGGWETGSRWKRRGIRGDVMIDWSCCPCEAVLVGLWCNTLEEPYLGIPGFK